MEVSQAGVSERSGENFPALMEHNPLTFLAGIKI